MSTAYETPPAATGGVGTNDSAGKQPNARSDAQDAQRPQFWDKSPFPIMDDLPEDDGGPDNAESVLTLPPGLTGEIAAYVYNSALYPMREGALLAAFGLMAGLTGRAFNYRNTGLNLYLLLLAPSGRGKEAMAQGINRLVTATRNQVPMIDDFIGPTTFASGPALLRIIGKQPCFLSIQGEFGLRLQSLNDPRAPQVVKDLRQVMLDVFGKSGRFDTLNRRSYSDESKDHPIVQSPCVSILGESTPEHVFGHLSFSDIEDGLLPRCLLLECNDARPRQNQNAGQPPSDALVNQLAELATLALTMRQNSSYCDVVATPQAAELLQSITNEIDDAYNEGAAFEERALWNRAALIIGRMSALVAVGCNPQSPVIAEEHAQWAAAFVRLCIKRLSSKFRAGIVGTGEARQEGELRKYIAEYANMTPERRRTYKVPHALAIQGHFVGLDYLKRRARRCSAFTQDRRGLNMAVDSTLIALCKTGQLAKLTPREVFDNFGLRCEVYALGKG
jgi:hypothetical protein